MKKVTITYVSATEKRELWLALRRQHITATDWPKITGTNPWASAGDVISDKRSSGNERWSKPDLPLQIGTDLEPMIIEKVKKMLGPGEFLSQAFVSRGHLGFTPDLARINGGSDWVLAEIKVSVMDWRGAVPAYCLDQVKFQATVLGIDQVQVIHLKLASWEEGLEMIEAGSVPMDRLAVYRVDVSEAARKLIERKAERWWKAHIVDGEPV